MPDYINKKIRVNSITDNLEYVEQDTLTIQEHNVRKKYIMLSNNSFGSGTVQCPGYFNYKTNFVIGEKHSIMSINKFLKLSSPDTSTLINNPDEFMIYPIPCFAMKQNYVLEYVLNDNSIIDVSFDYDFGYLIGQFLVTNDYSLLSNYNPKFIKLLLDTKSGLSINKNVLINTNYKFVIGILEGYYKTYNSNGFYIAPNVNIYTITTILNYLGASYSIRNARNSTKKVYMQLPPIFKDTIKHLYIKKDNYIIHKNEIVYHNNFNIFADTTNILASQVNSGKVLLVPFKSIIFEESCTNTRMFDLTSERSDATNYSVGFSPIMKNSDGDLLAVNGIFTKEGLVDVQKFSPEHKEYYKDLNDGSIHQWIADDAILGLYNATRK